MGYKETFLSELIRDDHTGLLSQLHERLIAAGLKFRASANTDTLLYYVFDTDGKQVGLAAFRVPGSTHFSFPSAYWSRYSQEVNAALVGIPPFRFVETEGPVSSSQYSMRQIVVSNESIAHLISAIEELIAPHVRIATGDAA